MVRGRLLGKAVLASVVALQWRWSFCVAGLDERGAVGLRERGSSFALGDNGRPDGGNVRSESSIALNALPLVAAGISSCLLLRGSLVVIREGQTALVERLGRFNRKLEPGLHLKLPVIDSVRAILTVREQVLDIPPQSCITSDNAPLQADAVVYWRIFDAAKAVYAVDQLVLAIQNLVLTQLRSEIGKLTLDETFSARENMNAVLLKDVDVATDPWGVKITRVEIRDIIPNREILSSMELQMAAERTKRADIIKSEGQKQALLNDASAKAEARVLEAESQKAADILKAEAEKQRLVREAEGTAEALRIVAAAAGSAERALQLQALKAYIDSQETLAKSPNAKVLCFPSSEAMAKASAITGELQGAALADALRQS
eukprot:TRINITY_DN54406_c0_g1_i2.p1 TRINITY_DN54406_c0_g1~~TRINITY_DN54406_c0_g1_i2.p1  ORF type:complete len:387 (-),score=96.84 TRINITY_DN54406_c0_g1_i2:17-1138(-)